MSETNVMIDIETLGTKPGCVVCSIGAVAWCWDSELQPTFFTGIAIDDCQTFRLEIDAGTLLWWLEQDEVVRNRALRGSTGLLHALYGLSDFIEREAPAESRIIWAKPPSFDVALLEECYRRVRVKAPWHFRDVRDVRTYIAAARALGFEEPPRTSGQAHDTLDDAMHQVSVVRAAHQVLLAGRNARGREQSGVQC